ncbi:hypothetical protein WG66_014828 [Moniliophthora roreri]|nr:hypothetical protein WG66_014828 [Moniliophthora roreri]
MTNAFSKLARGNSLPEDPEAERKCHGCGYRGLVKTFPRRVNDLGYKTKRKTCDKKDKIGHICKRWETIVSLVWSPQGLHPKVHQGIKRAWDDIDKLGGEIEQEITAKKMRRTYKDSNSNTMYMK